MDDNVRCHKSTATRGKSGKCSGISDKFFPVGKNALETFSTLLPSRSFVIICSPTVLVQF